MNTPRKMAASACAAMLLLTGCAVTYDERMNYLRKVANRGADTHKFIRAQEALVDKARCERAFTGNGAGRDAPTDRDLSSGSEGWDAQVKEFFVDSCISGKPKAVPGDPIPEPSASVSG
jgi:hypothetical protein